MSPGRGQRPQQGGGFPRVSGDEPANHTLGFLISEFSPRERG